MTLRPTAVLVFVALAPAACGESPILDPGAELVFYGAQVWDGTGTPTTGPAMIQIAGSRVLSVKPLPEGADVATEAGDAGVSAVDLSGRYVIPGLVNVHGHVGGNWEDDMETSYSDYMTSELQRYARFGVTTVNSLGDDGQGSVALRDASWGEAPPDRARLLIAGDVVVGQTPDEATAMVDANQQMGVDWIKIRVDDNLGSTSKMTPEVYEAVIDRAHGADLPLSAHLFYMEDAKGLLAAGADMVAHSVRDQEVDPELIGQLRESGVCYVPTLTREVSTYIYGERPDFFDDDFLMSDVDEAQVLAVSDPGRMEAIRNARVTRINQVSFEIAKHNLKRLSESGVTIGFGTDTGPLGRFQGYFEHMEMELMAESGLSTEEILRSATGVAATCLRRDDVGILEAGRRADFVVLTEDPMGGVRTIRKIESVWIGGRRIDGSNKLD